MAAITEIIVSIQIYSKSKQLAQAEVSIPVEQGKPIKARDLTDACQRSVAHCIDALKKELDY